MKHLILIAALVVSASTSAFAISKTIQPWMFMMQLAQFKAPSGCQLDTPGVDGSNYDPAKTVVPVRLTNAQGQSDTAMVAPNTLFVVSFNSNATFARTRGLFNGKRIETIVGTRNQMLSAQVGNVRCGN